MPQGFLFPGVQEGFGYDKVLARRDLDVLITSLKQRDNIACPFGHAGIVGEAGVFLSFVSFFYQSYVERLRSLDEPELRPVHGVRVVLIGDSYGFFEAYGCDGGFVYGGEAEGGADDVFADEWAYAVVYGDESVVVDLFEAAFYRLEPGVAAGLEHDGCCEVMFLRKGGPGFEVVLWKNNNNIDLPGIPDECIQSMDENRNAVEFQKLFWYGAIDACAFATGYDQCEFFWVHPG